MKKTIGVLGGMGPEATAVFFELVIKNTKASKDQDHIPILIWNDPRIPPRTDAILKTGPCPLPLLKEGAKRLAAAGADFLVMPCITAHYFFSEIASASPVPMVNLIEETLNHAVRIHPRLKRAGLLASTGTVKSKLFPDAFSKSAIKILTPLASDQNLIMDAVFGRKGAKAGFTSGYSRDTVIAVALRLIKRGAEAIVAGCTEIPLLLKDEDIPVPLLEPMRIGARVCIRKAGYKIRA